MRHNPYPIKDTTGNFLRQSEGPHMPNPRWAPPPSYESNSECLFYQDYSDLESKVLGNLVDLKKLVNNLLKDSK